MLPPGFASAKSPARGPDRPVAAAQSRRGQHERSAGGRCVRPVHCRAHRDDAWRIAERSESEPIEA